MSGTSLDGDAALVETDGETIVRFGPSGCRPYSETERGMLRAALAAAETLADRSSRPGMLGPAETAENADRSCVWSIVPPSCIIRIVGRPRAACYTVLRS
jgi:1,6-anhydro-N-acetylmuramate kinase